MSNPIKSLSKVVKKSLFIISPIGEEDSEIRIFFNKVRRNIIDPVAEEMGYDTERSDDIQKPGTITKQIIEALRTSDLVVADLSRKNPNVFYELAVRHAVGKSVILLSAIGDTIPFDLSAQRVIFYDFDPDHIREAKEDLTEQIRQVESETFVVDSPIDRSLIIGIPDDQISEPTEETQVLAILRKQSEDIGRILRQIDEPTQVPIKYAQLYTAPSMRGLLKVEGVPSSVTLEIFDFLKRNGPSQIQDIVNHLDFSTGEIRLGLRSLMAHGIVHQRNTDPKTYVIIPEFDA